MTDIFGDTTRAELQQEIDRLRAERDALKDANAYLAGHAGAVRIAYDTITAERDAIAAEVAALKANDPLAEMWRELQSYQEQADRDGHGESWAKMCEERTGESAWEAMREARNAARNEARDAAKAAAQALADATEWAVNAIDAIRRAKEARR